MPENLEKTTVLIPPVKRVFLSLARKVRRSYCGYLVLIFGMFCGLVALLTYLPAPYSLKMTALLVGSFILEDLHHSIKKIWNLQ